MKQVIVGRRSEGFTLVELAVVLVIVGLLMGGVLKGRQLVESARVRNLMGQMEALRGAILLFRDRYGALPGDFSRATTLLDATAADGDGNGMIDSNAERAGVWQQLAQAGLIAGGYDGVGVSSVWNNCPPSRCPANLFGGDIKYNWGALAVGGAGSRNELRTGGRIPVALLAEVDRRIDDGAAASGEFQAADYNAGECLVAGEWNLTAADAPQDCAAVLLF